MITLTTQRYEPDGDPCGSPILREESPGRATISLVRFELGYGGRVHDVEPTRLKVHTPCIGRYDISEFSGSEADMRPLLTAVGTWLHAKMEFGKGVTEKTAVQLVAAKMARPLLVSMAGCFMFRNWVTPVLCAVAGFSDQQTMEFLERKLDSDVVDPIMELIIDGASVEDGLSLMGAAKDHDCRHKPPCGRCDGCGCRSARSGSGVTK